MNTAFNHTISACFIAIWVIAGDSIPAAAQTATRGTAMISGRVSIGDRNASGVEVLLKKSSNQRADFDEMQTPARSMTTDAEGNYRIANLAAGTYRVTVYAPAYMVAGESHSGPRFGKVVNLAEGEAVGNIDFSLTLGGVITGRVTDDSGNPIIAENIGVFQIDEQRRPRVVDVEMAQVRTDDRGIYRIFGLDAGRYIIGAGTSKDDLIGSRSIFNRIYHPDTVEVAKATVIEVGPGVEIENVDLKLSRATKGYVAAGRVIDTETGNPVPGMKIGYAIRKMNSGMWSGVEAATTNSNGEFRLEKLSASSYSAYILNNTELRELYADPIDFEIVDRNITGLEIKLNRGASISGVAVIDGVRDPAIVAGLSKIPLRVIGVQDQFSVQMSDLQGGRPINLDGTFRVGGVRPGKQRIVALMLPTPMNSPPKGYTLLRVEQNGVEIKDFSISPGEQISGVRLVFTYGTGIIAGRVEIKGGELPPNAIVMVSARLEGSAPDDFWSLKTAQTDPQGNFVIEGLAPAKYMVRLMVGSRGPGPRQGFPVVEQEVAVSGDGRQDVRLVLDLARKDGRN